MLKPVEAPRLNSGQHERGAAVVSGRPTSILPPLLLQYLACHILDALNNDTLYMHQQSDVVRLKIFVQTDLPGAGTRGRNACISQNMTLFSVRVFAIRFS